MRIAIIMDVNSPWSRQVAFRLTELGHRVQVIGFSTSNPRKSYLSLPGDIQSESIDALKECVEGLHFIESRLNSDIRYFLYGSQVRDIYRECGAEVLLVLYGGGFATLAYYSGIRPFIIYAVGSDVLLARGIKRWIARRNFTSANIVFSNGAYLKERTQQLAPKATVEQLYMGVDTKRFSVSEPIPESSVGIVCTRGFIPVYNNEVLIRALVLLSGHNTDVQVVFTSTGPQLGDVCSLADTELSEKMRRNVKFCGWVSDDDLLANLKKSQIYVSLSGSDGTSISLLEALSCGLFPVISDIPQNREWINPGIDNGILVPLDQPEALAVALERAIIDRDLREHAAKINRQLVMERADGRKNMSILASKLEAVVHAQDKRSKVSAD